MFRSMPLYWHLTNIHNSRHIMHAWLDKDYSLPGMSMLVPNKLWYYNTSTSNTPSPHCKPQTFIPYWVATIRAIGLVTEPISLHGYFYFISFTVALYVNFFSFKMKGKNNPFNY